MGGVGLPELVGFSLARAEESPWSAAGDAISCHGWDIREGGGAGVPVTVAKRGADGVTVLAMRGPRSSYEIGVHLRLMVAQHGLPVLFDLMPLFIWVARSRPWCAP